MSGQRYRVGIAVGAAVALAAAAAPAQAATSWAVLSTPNRGAIANELYGSAALSPSSAWAVGSWYDANLAAPRTLVERWNGTAWSTVTSPNATRYHNELRDVDATSATNAWAVGYANGDSGVNGLPRNTLAMRWNGSSWSVIATPQPGTNVRQLYGVKAFSTGEAWSVGWYYDTNFHGEALMLHWSGSTWTQVAVPGPGTSGNSLEGIAGSAPNDVWAVGYYTDSGENGVLGHPFALHYNGTSWTPAEMPESGTGTFLHSVAALSANDVWAVGSKNGYHEPVASAGGQIQPLVQRWNGTAFAIESVPQQQFGGQLYPSPRPADPPCSPPEPARTTRATSARSPTTRCRCVTTEVEGET
ncbi:hypothetical protein [Actinoplanes sp. NPDC026623]|uniref:WD40/YVTN/BNR-like repeat-containing protein n=1 Tax=Actinoplanes sp. NPDC026623 TaxID=3155610 RepID=UPI0034101D9A